MRRVNYTKTNKHPIRYFGRAKDLPGVRELFEQEGMLDNVNEKLGIRFSGI